MAKKGSPYADKIWAYKIKHPTAKAREIADATNTSYGYVYKLLKKIGTPDEVFEKEARKVTRGQVLDTAKEYVTKDRAADHGNMEDNFKTIGKYWSVHLGMNISATDVAVMMTLLKIARIKSNPSHPDNWVDACGYMSCGGEIVSKG
tara:strand:- start:994 stop:1434 length:441 start_codon:yes stop_codon:yes gene_type:complete